MTFDPAVDTSPSWSRDGRIFFTSNRDGRREIYVMNANGSGVTRFTTMGATSAAWSPDGSKVAFISYSLEPIYARHPLEVFVAHRDGSNVRMVTSDPVSAFVPLEAR